MTVPNTWRGGALLRTALRPPVRDVRFWVVQAAVVGLAVIHYVADVSLAQKLHSIPAGVPVVLLLAPVGYAAVRYGLAGSVVTAIWASLLWLPDLLLPHDKGHIGNDGLELAIVIAVAGFVGYYIDKERHERDQVATAMAAHRAAEARYRQLFDTNVAPVLVLDQDGTVLQANPAARSLFCAAIIGQTVSELIGRGLSSLSDHQNEVVTLPGASDLPCDYRVSAARVPLADPPLVQLMLQDVTEERAEGQQARDFAALLLRAQEEERQRIARELHDEPLQLVVSLARSLERASDGAPLSAAEAADLAAARDQTLDIAAMLRDVVRGLRPPALVHLGLTAALRGFLVGVGEVSDVRTRLEVVGRETRLPLDLELGAFRIAQEAVNNAVRHAAGDQIRVTITFSSRELRLTLADNGRGFEPSALTRQPRADRMGVLGMRERAHLLHGRLTIRSGPDVGTVIEVVLPIPSAAGDAGQAESAGEVAPTILPPPCR